ncbi:hypothetical protein SETIT_J031400v2 [Setaria italica]|uniref:Phospholipase D C-terminal domain-containing protein n=1 Tax=Setaria italica TaxID=4555 RepID=A0A368PFQ6_SETIT|nr:hypothetical protein SETIT_J031400v2 [Setaria italica]
MSLRYEHLDAVDEAFTHPESLECVCKVNAMADMYWDLYVGDGPERDLPGNCSPTPSGSPPMAPSRSCWGWSSSRTPRRGCSAPSSTTSHPSSPHRG